ATFRAQILRVRLRFRILKSHLFQTSESLVEVANKNLSRIDIFTSFQPVSFIIVHISFILIFIFFWIRWKILLISNLTQCILDTG
ncbi:hypothetical protein PMAYCL1PPCAC_04992, partial [Pristionchus mayeri]